MADRTTAHLFGRVFEHLAAGGTERDRELAHWLWEQTGDYDFSPYQIGADDALVALGLARMGVDPDYPQDGEVDGVQHLAFPVPA